MNRVRNSGGHAPVLRHELVERLDCLGVTQDDGNLPAFGAVGGLAFRAGLWGRHGLEVDVAEAFCFLASDPQTVARRVSPDLKNGGVSVDVGQSLNAGVCGADARKNVGEQALLARPSADQFGEVVVDGEGLGGAHIQSPVGPIPTMCPSYPVTSDVSTTVRREAA